LNKKLAHFHNPREIVENYYHSIKKSILAVSSELAKNKVDENILKKKFSPSKTAQNGLNFFTKENENYLLKSDSKEAKDILKLIYILLNEKYDHLSDTHLGLFLLKNILPRYKVENISKNFSNIEMLFLNVIYEKVFSSNEINESQSTQFNEIIQNRQELIQPYMISVICLPASFLCFSLKEIHEVLALRSSPEFKWRREWQYLKRLRADEEKYKKYIP
jgi:hypothetical protein